MSLCVVAIVTAIDGTSRAQDAGWSGPFGGRERARKFCSKAYETESGLLWTSVLTYDKLGRVAAVRPNDGSRAEYSYSEHGYTIVHFDSSGKSTGRTEVKSDARDRIVEIRSMYRDGKVHVSRYTYDKCGEANAEPAVGYPLVRRCDSNGRVHTIRTGPGTRRFYYRADGRPERKEVWTKGARRPTETEEYYYDAAGRMVAAIARNGAGAVYSVTTYSFDVSGNVTEALHLHGSLDGLPPLDTFRRETFTYECWPPGPAPEADCNKVGDCPHRLL